MNLSIYRNAQEVGQLMLDDRTVFTHKLMGEHKIVVDSIAHQPLAIQIGDYIEWRNERYYINTAPGLEKINNITYRYLIEFEGEIYRLYNKIFINDGQASFSYHGDPQLFLELILTNINSIDAGWTIQNVDAAPAQTLTFADATCRAALTQIAEAFGLEYRVASKGIYLQKSVGAETTLQFEYGRGKGLYNLQRNRIDDKNVVTRVYGFGARKNLAQDYRDGATRLVFESRYLEQNTELYGIREGSVSFDDIYPQRTGTVTGIDAEDRLKITDTDLNFDINDYLLEGTVAKVVFKTGALAGYEFEIDSYNHPATEIRFLPFVEENGYTLPNELNYPEVDDEFTLVDIKMPEAYITEAEAELKAETQAYLDENSVPRVMYDLNLDEKYVRERGVDLRVGNLVRVLDAQLGVNAQIRVVEVSYPLVNPASVTAVIADTIPYTIQERLVANAVDNRTEIRDVERERVELARRSALRFRNLQGLIFDPDGYFNPENIKPLSIETLMLSVGAKSQNFGLIGVTIQANAEGNANTLSISGGQLAHYEIEIEELGYVWEIDPVVFPDLDPEKPYYVYARCSTTSLTGEWMISEEPMQVDAEVGKYLFNLGVLYPVTDGRRDFDFTNGMTFVNGDTITTGRIKSIDGLNYFDLSEGKFKIGNEDSSLDFNVTEEGRLTLKGVLVSSMILADTAAIENLTVRNLRTRDEGRRVEITEATNAVTLFDQDGEYVATLDDEVDENYVDERLAGLKTRNPSNERQSTLTGNGLRTNGSGIYIEAPGITGRASIYAEYAGENNFDSAAIAGYAPTGKGLAGLFVGGLKVTGATGLFLSSSMHYNTRRISTSLTLTSRDHYISCYNTSTVTLYLPKGPEVGRVIIIRRMNDAAIAVQSSDRQMVQGNVTNKIFVGQGKGDIGQFVYDGRYWLYNVMLR